MQRKLRLVGTEGVHIETGRLQREREDCKGNGRTAKRVERNGEWSREGLAKKAEAGRYGGSARMGTRGMAPAWYLQATFVALCVLCPHDLAKKSD